MASQTLASVADVFPVGTTVGAYLASGWSTAQLPPAGAPVPSATTTAVVASDGSLAFTGLADDTRYYAGASVSGTWRYRGFRTPAPTQSAGSSVASAVTFTPAGSIAASNVQAAVQEVATDALTGGSTRELWQGMTTWTSLNASVVTPSAGVVETHQMQFEASRDLIGVRLVYQNSYGIGESITNVLDNTFSAVVISGSTRREVSFNGARTTLLRARRWVISDPVSISVAKGGSISVASYANTTGGGWPTTRTILSSNAGEGNNRASGAADLTHESDSAPATATIVGWGPVAIIGIPKVASPYAVVGIGDSIMEGEDWLTAALCKITSGLGLHTPTFTDGAVPWINGGMVSAAASQFATATSSEFRRELCRHATHVIFDMQVNDNNSGRTLSQIATDLQTSWDVVSAAGAEVIAVTGTPITTSTDSWVTTVNQTVATAYNSNTLNALNTWIKTLPPPVTKVIDKASAVMSGNVWAAPGGVANTIDGTHLSSTGAALAAATVPVTTWFPYTAPAARTNPAPAALTSLPTLTTGGAAYWEEYNAASLSGSTGDIVATLPGLRNGRDLTQATAGKQPTLLTNGAAYRNMLRFDRTAAHFLQTAALTLNQPLTVVMAFRRVLAWAGNETLLSDRSLLQLKIEYTNATSLRAGTGGTLPTVTMGDSLIHVLSWVIDGASTEIRRDNANAVTGTITTANPGGLTLAANGNGTNPASIDLGQMVVCTGHLNNTDLAAIYAVLKANWETP